MSFKRKLRHQTAAEILVLSNPTFCRKLVHTEHKTHPIQDRINRTVEVRRPFEYLPTSYSGFKRPERPRGHYRKHSLTILQQLTGSEGIEFLERAKSGFDRRYEWLLKKISERGSPSFLNYEIMFLQAIAKDAGVLPAPKWWTVTRRLKGLENLSSGKRK